MKQRDAKSLVEKMMKFIELTDSEKENMGKSGRIKIEKEFDRNIVIEAYIKEIKKIIH